METLPWMFRAQATIWRAHPVGSAAHLQRAQAPADFSHWQRQSLICITRKRIRKGSMTNLDKLERLNALRASGGLSPDEYEREKAKVLAESRKSVLPILLAVLAVVAVAVAVLGLGGRQESKEAPAAEFSTSPSAFDPAAPFANNSVAAPSPTPSKNIDPPVPKAAAPDPTNTDYYIEAKRDMMRAYRSQPPSLRELLGDWAGANTLCRGSSDEATINKWCPIRESLSAKLEKLNWCYGRPTDQSAAESDWHPCDYRDRQ